MARNHNRLSANITADSLETLKRNLEELSNYSVEVGIFAADDSFYAMIANVHEYGITITPKNGQYLTIPVSPKSHGKRAADFPNIFRPKGKNVLAIPDGQNGFEVLFALKESVVIPERSFVRSTFDEKEESWSEFLKGQISLVINGQISAEDMYNRMGSIAAANIQEKMVNSSPANAGATVSAKGSSNPLVDTGGLRQRVTWKVVRRNA